jgi:HEAT repeat protein
MIFQEQRPTRDLSELTYMNLLPLVLVLGLAPGEKVFIPAIPQPPIPVPAGGGIGTTPAHLGSLSTTAGGPGDEEILKRAKLGVKDEELLEFFRKRTPPAPNREALLALVKKLANKDTADAAQADLVAIGLPAIPLLRQEANNSDSPEASPRAKECLKNIEGPMAAALVTNAARLLAQRKTPGAAKVLVDYLPYSEDDQTFSEIEVALVALALTKDNKPEPALVNAIKDSLAIRRASAARILCKAAGALAHEAIRPLLKDERPSVRLGAALGLVESFDAEAIGVLIDLQSEVSPVLRSRAEEYLVNLAGEWTVNGPKGNDSTARRLRREIWAAWWKSVDGDNLLAEFKERTSSDEDYDKVSALIAQLANTDATKREAAVTALTALGKVATSQLRRAVSENAPIAGPLAQRCLDASQKDAPPPLPSAATRLLGLRKPAGMAEALLAYVPFAESAESYEQIIDILGAVGVVGGKADAALVKGLEDKLAVRRGAAALVLCRGKATAQVAKIRKLLEDKDKLVQFRAAQGLASLGEKDAIPALISLLKELPLEQAMDVEDFLYRVAGEKSPTEVVTAEAASRTKAAEAWTKWWKENEKGIDLVKIDAAEKSSGLYIFLENFNPAIGRGRVCEVDAAGKIRWEVRDLQWPNDVQILRGGKVLVIEQQQRLTERDRTGKIVGLDRYLNSPFHAERLRDGTTFVACRNQLIIINAKGENVFTHNYNMNSILAAKRFRDGSMAYVSYSGHYVKLDRTGKQIKSINMPWFNYSANGAEILANDRVILSDGRFNKVLELDMSAGTGKVVWEVAVSYPLIPTQAPNGNILVTGNSNSAVYEIDRRGKIVKEWKDFTLKPYRVYKR